MKTEVWKVGLSAHLPSPNVDPSRPPDPASQETPPTPRVMKKPSLPWAQPLAVHGSIRQVHVHPLGSAQISLRQRGVGEELLLIRGAENTAQL